jgi:hypothetical protein
MTAAQRSTANRMIAAKGQTVTLTRRASGTYDPATGSAAITETTQTGKGVILPLAGYRKIGVGNIAIGDETLLLSALGGTGTLSAPHVDDEVTDANGNVYALTVIDPLHPAGLDIMFDCVIRRAA